MKWWDTGDMIHLQLGRSLPGFPYPRKDGVTPARRDSILIAKVSFNWTTMVTVDSVLAMVSDAVNDLPLLRTTDYDCLVEEHIQVQEQLDDLISKHGLLKCMGLVKMEGCVDCKSIYGDAMVGARLALQLARLDTEFRKALEDDDEFDPREFTDQR